MHSSGLLIYPVLAAVAWSFTTLDIVAVCSRGRATVDSFESSISMILEFLPKRLEAPSSAHEYANHIGPYKHECQRASAVRPLARHPIISVDFRRIRYRLRVRVPCTQIDRPAVRRSKLLTYRLLMPWIAKRERVP